MAEADLVGVASEGYLEGSGGRGHVGGAVAGKFEAVLDVSDLDRIGR